MTPAVADTLLVWVGTQPLRKLTELTPEAAAGLLGLPPDGGGFPLIPVLQGAQQRVCAGPLTGR
jgi:hypothetical protein